MDATNEVRRQFAEIPGLAEGTANPEYGRCVAIVTTTALRQLIVPGTIAVVAPLAVLAAVPLPRRSRDVPALRETVCTNPFSGR